eukprot:6479356-Amphidinium_carterae.2
MVNQHVAHDDYVLHRDKNNLPGSLNYGSSTQGGRIWPMIWVADYAGPSPVPREYAYMRVIRDLGRAVS